MRVIGIDLYRVRLPLRFTFETSSHRKDAIEHILVRFQDESDLDGWGEIACGNGPWFSAEYVSTAWAVATQFLAPAVLDEEWRHPADLTARWSGIAGHQAAKAGFDGAAWDLAARRDGVPLAVALGTSPRAIPVGVSVGIEKSVERLVERVGGYLAEGYHRVKLKIRPGWDAEPVRAVRCAYPDLLLHVDANGAYRPGAESDEVMRQLDGLDLAMVEQPYPGRDFVSHARLRQRITTPLCLDESIEDAADLDTMLALDAARMVNIKVSRVGGLTAALALDRRCADHDVGVWCGGMHEFGVGRAANIAFACDPAFDYPSDISGSDKYFARDVVDPPIVARNGYVSPAAGPGLGLAVDLAWIESIALDTSRHRALR